MYVCMAVPFNMYVCTCILITRFAYICFLMQCPKDHDEVKGIIPKCRPQCGLNYYKSKKNTVGACSNPNMEKLARNKYLKPKKSRCKNGWFLMPFTRYCYQICLPGWSSKGDYCVGHKSCNTKHFIPMIFNKNCKPRTKTKRWHRSSCAKYKKPARINIANDCMKNCEPGEGETPIGLCVEFQYDEISPAEVIDFIASELVHLFMVKEAFHDFLNAYTAAMSIFKRFLQLTTDYHISTFLIPSTDLIAYVGKAIMAPIEATIGKALDKLFESLFKNVPGLPAWIGEGLPEVGELPTLPAPPSLPSLGPINEFVANAEKIVNIPEQYFDQLAEKIPDLPELPSADEISAQIDNVIRAGDEIKKIAGNVTSLLGMISGCKQTTKLQVPSLTSLFKTLDLPGSASWQDCNIEIPVCSQLDIADASIDKLNEIEEIFGKLETVTEVFGQGRRKLNVFKEWRWIMLPLPLGVFFSKLVGKFFPDYVDHAYGKKAHLGTWKNIFGKGQIPLNALGKGTDTDKATFSQYFWNMNFLNLSYPKSVFVTTMGKCSSTWYVNHITCYLSGRLVPCSLC